MAKATIDGNDIARCTTRSRRPRSAAAPGEGPTLIEALTYRHKGHSRTDPRTYRPKGELEAWLARDPILRLEARPGDDGRRGTDDHRRSAHAAEAEDRRRRWSARSGWDEPDARGPARGRAGMSEMTFREAVRRRSPTRCRRPRVFFLGEDVAAAGGAFKVTEGLLRSSASARVLDTPISEQAIIGTAIGAAVKGLRPVAELMFADFAGVCFDQIANQLAKYRYMTGGQVSLPVTIRIANGAGLGFGAQHSQTVENWFLNVTGLLIVAPSTPADAYGLLRAAIREPEPGARSSSTRRSTTPAARWTPPRRCPRSARRRIARSGTDVTIVATQLMVHRALDAAEQLAADGVEAEVVDLRTLAPMDAGAVRESLGRTRNLVVVQEGAVGGRLGRKLVTQVATAGVALDSPPQLIASAGARCPTRPASRRPGYPAPSGSPMRSSSGQESADGRGVDGQAVGHHGGGHHRGVARAGGRHRRGGRRAGRDPDRQGHRRCWPPTTPG